MQKITPFLWFDTQAEDAANFYVSLFPNSRITYVSRYGDAGPGPKGSAMVVSFELDGQRYNAINGGPTYKLSPAFSLSVSCKDQAEVDFYWNKLLEGGGVENQCAWLQDRFGLSWQIVPDALPRYLGDSDRAKANRVMLAMLKMKKIIVADLDKAYAA
ncbi:MAG TPA: VOC family protein [Devosiaceae bacterium]|jgi:predicted 3-demethylubiquinone-9 3-methyltransferase (glyoxalase superfamily)|nr:VOC family protein [Devosiaceae bacterium]